MSKGMRSSEFWVTIISGLVTAFGAVQGSIPPDVAVWIGAALAGIYTFARSLVKSKQGEGK